jgi:peptidyl-prolyl cis-trans isomerase SurA
MGNLAKPSLRGLVLASAAAACLGLPSRALAQIMSDPAMQSVAPGAMGPMGYDGRPNGGSGYAGPHGDPDDAKPEHTEAPPGEEPAIRIPAPKLETAPPDADAIAAVVNGDVITRADVANRARLFGLSTGLTMTPDLLNRLRPQIIRQLIDDKLQMQEIQRRRIVVADGDVAAAIASVEQRNGLPPGGLREKLAAQGVSYGTLISQMRTQLGWTRVLRQELNQRGFVTPAEVDEQEKIYKASVGQPQYRVADIFVPAQDPSRQNDARQFADTVIEQLRNGAQFGIVAAEFSQGETALKGGELGWVRPDQLDPQVAALITQMPVGAISNPVKVAGGFEVVTLQDKRTVGNDLATVLNLRQAFYPFTSQLDPQNPTDQQKSALAEAQALSKTASSCDAVEAANNAQGGKRPSNPGDVRLDRMNPQMQALLKSLQPGHASKALVTPEGVMVIMVCSSAEKNMAAMTREDIADQLVEERVELASRQLQQDLKRRALIEQRES